MFTRNVFSLCSFYCHQNNGQNGSTIHYSHVTFGTMLNNNGGNDGRGPKNVTYKETLSLHSH